MDSNELPNVFEDLIGSVTKMGAPASASVLEARSSEYDIQTLIDDRICGLLLEDTLTVEQIQLLSALLQGR